MVYLHVLLLILMISSSVNCTQIVPYNPPEIIKPFHEKTREFFLGRRKWSVTQDWEHAGVAGVVWEAALELGNHLGSNPSLVADKRVIELGAGTGLVGMVAGHMGARCVDITDRNIEFARLNLENNLPNNQSVSVTPYEWGKPIIAPLALPYDLVLGSDIIYIEDTYDLLVQSLEYLCNKDTVVLLASKLRYNKVENFMKLLKVKFDFHVINNNEKHGIYIYRVTLKV